jgi:hypothetical protein
MSPLVAGTPVEIPSDEILLSPLLDCEEPELTPEPELILFDDLEVAF